MGSYETAEFNRKTPNDFESGPCVQNIAHDTFSMCHKHYSNNQKLYNYKTTVLKLDRSLGTGWDWES